VAVVPEQGLLSFLPMTLAATTVNSTNPNTFGVYLQVAGGTVTNITVNGVLRVRRS
jgi:hypothetical protein